MIEHFSDAVIHQSHVFASAILWGIILVFSYDCIRVIRRVWHCGKCTAAAQDILFWVLWAFLIYTLLYRYDYGAVRSYTIVGMTLGMCSYHILVSWWLVKYASEILNKVKGWVIRPFRLVYGKIRNALTWMRTKFKKNVNSLSKVLKKVKKPVTIRQARKQGKKVGDVYGKK